MKRRVFISAALSLLAASPTWADGGSGKSGGGDDGGDDEGGGDDHGGDDGDDDEGGDPGSGGGGPTNPPAGSGNGATAGQLDRSGILSLKRMLAIFRDFGQAATIIDVRLLERSNVLVYAFKFIDTQGRVRRAYFDAHTGKVIA